MNVGFLLRVFHEGIGKALSDTCETDFEHSSRRREIKLLSTAREKFQNMPSDL